MVNRTNNQTFEGDAESPSEVNEVGVISRIEGLEKLRHDKEFDVALVDLKMPKMDGIEMIKEAHKAGNNAEMIILSDDKESEKADAIAAIKVGVKDWFEKSELHKPKLFTRITDALHLAIIKNYRYIKRLW